MPGQENLVSMVRRTSQPSPPPPTQLNPPQQAIPPELLQSEEEDDDEKFAPHLLFSQSQTLAASQVQRQLAAELSVRYQEEEEDRTVVKEQSPDSPIAFPGPLPTGSVTKGISFPQVDYIIIDSSPEPQTLKKGIVQLSGSGQPTDQMLQDH